MALQLANNFRVRRSFGRIGELIDIPHLLEIQRRSYDEFLQRVLWPEQTLFWNAIRRVYLQHDCPDCVRTWTACAAALDFAKTT